MLRWGLVLLLSLALAGCFNPAPPPDAQSAPAASGAPPALTERDFAFNALDEAYGDVSITDEAAGGGSMTWLTAQDTMGDHDTVWQPAETPPGGTSWELLESTKEVTRVGDDGYIRSKPVFPAAVRALEGKRVTVAGWMMPLENGARQRRFVLLAYPPGCPFHFHALPNQFIEVLATEAVRLDEVNVTIVSGVLELTGDDESGIFYKLRDARAV